MRVYSGLIAAVPRRTGDEGSVAERRVRCWLRAAHRSSLLSSPCAPPAGGQGERDGAARAGCEAEPAAAEPAAAEAEPEVLVAALRAVEQAAAEPVEEALSDPAEELAPAEGPAVEPVEEPAPEPAVQPAV